MGKKWNNLDQGSGFKFDLENFIDLIAKRNYGKIFEEKFHRRYPKPL